jgi:hypothetical protein
MGKILMILMLLGGATAGGVLAADDGAAMKRIGSMFNEVKRGLRVLVEADPASTANDRPNPRDWDPQRGQVGGGGWDEQIRKAQGEAAELMLERKQLVEQLKVASWNDDRATVAEIRGRLAGIDKRLNELRGLGAVVEE